MCVFIHHNIHTYLDQYPGTPAGLEETPEGWPGPSQSNTSARRPSGPERGTQPFLISWAGRKGQTLKGRRRGGDILSEQPSARPGEGPGRAC